MTPKLFVERYWRIPLAALLVGSLAFAASFAVDNTYRSTTRMLIRGRDASFLTTTGQDLSTLPGVNNANTAQALAQTEAGLVSSRQVATMVVDRLHLDEASPPRHGIIASLGRAASSTYAHLNGWLTSGFYRKTGDREKAIQDTQASIRASQLATSQGGSSGVPASYILDITATATTAKLAQQKADAAAAALIEVSGDRFQVDARNYAKVLKTQLDQATRTVANDHRAIAEYEAQHHLTSLDEQLVQQVQSSGSLEAQVSQAKAAVQADDAKIASLEATLSSTDATASSAQNITTGRSETVVDQVGPNPVYQSLQTELAQARAAASADRARLADLQAQADATAPSAQTDAQAGLLDLQQQVSVDQDNQKKLAAQYSEAQTNLQVSPVEVIPIDAASLPTYPVSPKHYWYLLLGLLVGGLAGSGLTYLARRRELPAGSDDELDEPEDDLVIDLRDLEEPTRELVGVGATAAAAAGAAGAAGDKGPELPRDDLAKRDDIAASVHDALESELMGDYCYHPAPPSAPTAPLPRRRPARTTPNQVRLRMHQLSQLIQDEESDSSLPRRQRGDG